MTSLVDRLKFPSHHAEFEPENFREDYSPADSAFERAFMANLTLLRSKHAYSSGIDLSGSILPVHRPAAIRPYRRSGSALGPLVAPNVTEWAPFILSLLLVSAVLLCFSLVAVAASTPGSSFQEKYSLPQSPETLLKEILSREEFKQDQTQSFVERLLERLYKELVRLLVGILERFSSVETPQIDEKSAWIVVKMLLLGSAIVLAIYVLLRVFRVFRNRGIFSDNGFPEPEIGRPGRVAGSSDSWDQAVMLAEKANYAGALINLFRFAVLKLDEHGVLLFHRGKTNGEILESINNHSLREILAEMVPSFNRVRYGKASCDRVEYEHFLGLCRRLSERI